MNAEVRRILELAWPTSLGMLAFMGLNVVDTICVGQLGELPQAGVAAANGWGLSGAVLTIGAVRAMEPMVSQAHGEGDRQAGGQALLRMLALCLPLSAIALGWYLLAVPGLRALGQPEGVLPHAGRYAAIIGLSWPPILVMHSIRTFLQAIGKVKPAMVVAVVGIFAKIPLNLLLMRGWGPVPALGVAGVAWASVAVEGLLLGLLVLAAWPVLKEYWPERPDFSVRPILRLAGLGVPLGIQMGTEFWAFASTSMMMGWISERAMAAHTVAMNLASVSFMLPLGVSTAAAARVGHLLGAGEDWGRAARAALAVGVCTQLLSGLLFSFGGAVLVMPYSSEPDVRTLAASLLPIAATFQLFDGMQVIGFGILRGAGDVRMPTIANLLGYYVIALPLCWFFGVHQGGGPTAIWWGLSLGLAVVAGTLLLRIRHVHARGGVRLR